MTNRLHKAIERQLAITIKNEPLQYKLTPKQIILDLYNRFGDNKALNMKVFNTDTINKITSNKTIDCTIKKHRILRETIILKKLVAIHYYKDSDQITMVFIGYKGNKVIKYIVNIQLVVAHLNGCIAFVKFGRIHHFDVEFSDNSLESSFDLINKESKMLDLSSLAIYQSLVSKLDEHQLYKQGDEVDFELEKLFNALLK